MNPSFTRAISALLCAFVWPACGDDGKQTVDSSVADSSIADSTAGDSTAADTSVPDTAVNDTAPVDTAPTDTAPADTAPADTTVDDTAVPDTSADTGSTDTVEPPDPMHSTEHFQISLSIDILQAMDLIWNFSVQARQASFEHPTRRSKHRTAHAPRPATRPSPAHRRFMDTS